ncbi:hypothetical protein KP509_38G065700 [Ceratopteris richardii]|nr:hypothetical protein KP509_38G065700 [Ceratopteris richardii]
MPSFCKPSSCLDMEVRSGRRLLLAVVAVLTAGLCLTGPLPASCVRFEYPYFADDHGITLVTEGSWYTDDNPRIVQSAVWLTPLVTNAKTNMGRMVYRDPIQLLSRSPTNGTSFASFNTSFAFQIICTVGYGECGSGMAFFMSPSEQAPPDSDGAGLGLDKFDNSSGQRPPPYPFFALEFDTYQTKRYNDSAASHIGVDLNSLVSARSLPTNLASSHPDLYLYNNYTFIVWIEYDSPSSLMQIWMTNSTLRPLEPIFQLQFDLATLFPDDHYLYVGFSATNPDPTTEGVQANVIYSWNFSSVELADSTVSKNATHLPGIRKPSKSGPKRLLLALVFVVSVGILASLLCWFFWRMRRGRRETPIHEHFYPNQATRYTFGQLQACTQRFRARNKLGEGAFSIVYKGTLPDRSVVAVKRLKEGFRKEADFCTEIQIISKIRHRNLLQLKGWCYEKKEALLVYDCMGHGSLDAFLFGNKRGTLSSEERLRILVQVAMALEYLHGGLEECVLHRDVKAANVLLNDDLGAVLSDFGLARLIDHNRAVTMTIAGTPGYVAPEVVYTGKATHKSDVYSYGVLAIEVACGLSALEHKEVRSEDMRLIDWVWSLHEDGRLFEALDHSLFLTDNLRENSDVGDQELELRKWRSVLHIGLLCCDPTPDSRPSMREVVQALQGCVIMPLPIGKRAYPKIIDTSQGRNASIASTWEFYSEDGNSISYASSVRWIGNCPPPPPSSSSTYYVSSTAAQLVESFASCAGENLISTG